MKPQNPKVVVIGAGSLFFGRKAIWQMAHSPVLRDGTLALVDKDSRRLEKLKALAEKVAAHNGVKLKIEAATDRREVLPGANFVILSFARDNARYRGIDCEVSAKYGIRMCSGDTIGPGGVFRAMREFPEIQGCAEDVLELAPEAWVINYINPTAVHGMALKRYFPELKSFAICDAQWTLRERLARAAGILSEGESPTPEQDEAWDVRAAGPNHFTFLLRADYRGVDRIPDIIASMRVDAHKDMLKKEDPKSYSGSKGFLNTPIQLKCYEELGWLPTVTGHTKEYLRYWQGKGVTDEEIPPLSLFDANARLGWTDEVWRRVDAYLDGSVPIADFSTEFGPDPATDLVETMWGNLKKRFFINTWNRGAVENMADDAFLELFCELDMEGPRPLPVGRMPRGIRGLMEQVLDTHELTAEGVFKRDLSLLRRALLVDPLTHSIGDTHAVFDELFRAEKDALGAFQGYEGTA